MNGKEKYFKFLADLLSKRWHISDDIYKSRELLDRNLKSILGKFKESIFEKENLLLTFFILWDTENDTWSRKLRFLVKDENDILFRIKRYLWLEERTKIPGVINTVYSINPSPQFILCFICGECRDTISIVEDNLYGVPLIRICLDKKFFDSVYNSSLSSKTFVEKLNESDIGETQFIQNRVVYEYSPPILEIQSYNGAEDTRWKNMLKKYIRRRSVHRNIDAFAKVIRKQTNENILLNIQKKYDISEILATLLNIYGILEYYDPKKNIQRCKLTYFFSSSGAILESEQDMDKLQKDGGALIILENLEKEKASATNAKNDFYFFLNLISNIFSTKGVAAQRALLKNKAYSFSLRSAIATIMSRNMSHIAGSHVFQGIRNQLDSLREIFSLNLDDGVLKNKIWKDTEDIPILEEFKRLKEKMADMEDSDFWCYGKDIIKKIIVEKIVEKARDYYNESHQQKMDLVARMGSTLSSWGVGTDFYWEMILPFKLNSLLLQYINFSDGISINDYQIRSFYLKGNSLFEIKEKIIQNEVMLPERQQTLLINLSILKFVNKYFDKLLIESYPNRLVRIPDGVIGVQAFFGLLEGIIRNAGKHRKKKEEKKMEVKIIILENYSQLNKLLELNHDKNEHKVNKYSDTNLRENHENYLFCVISVNLDRNLSDADGEYLSKTLDTFISKEITNKSGAIDSVAWGMKELKITSAFLAGKKSLEVNDFYPNWIAVVPTKGRKIWKDRIERVAYVLKMQKPRYCNFILNKKKGNSVKMSEIEKNGISVKCIEDSEGSIDRIDNDYDFLIVDNSLRVIKKMVKESRSKFPKRILFMPLTEMEEIFKSSRQEIAIKIYNKWMQYIQCYLKRPAQNFSIFFEDNTLRNCGKKKLKEISAEFPENPDKLEHCSLKNANIWQHRGLSELGLASGKEVRGKDGIHFFLNGTYRDMFFSFLCNSLLNNPNHANSTFVDCLISMQIREMAIFDILIIDERLSRTVYKNHDLLQKLYWQGIDIAPTLNVLGKKINFVEENLLRDHTRRFCLCLDFDNNRNLKITKNYFHVKEVKTKNKLGVSQKKEERVPISKSVNFNIWDSKKQALDSDIEENNKYFFLSIHQTLFNEILNRIRVSKKDYKKEDLIEDLNKIFFVVLIHTGRGKPSGDEIPSNATYIEYSILEKYLVSEPSKFYLVQNMLSAKDTPEVS